MSREEAINNIKELQNTYITCRGEEDTVAVSLNGFDIEAFDMAIQALEQEPTTKNDLGVDAISRADARSLICKIDIKHQTFGMSRKAFKDLYNGIDEIPSVTPQEPTTKNDLGVDCVSRNEVEKLVYRFLQKGTDENIAFYEHFLDLPSVTPIRPKGHWVYDYTSADGHRTYHCSECGCYLQPKHSEPLSSFKWCSLCGADMREVVEE